MTERSVLFTSSSLQRGRDPTTCAPPRVAATASEAAEAICVDRVSMAGCLQLGRQVVHWFFIQIQQPAQAVLTANVLLVTASSFTSSPFVKEAGCRMRQFQTGRLPKESEIKTVRCRVEPYCCRESTAELCRVCDMLPVLLRMCCPRETPAGASGVSFPLNLYRIDTSQERFDQCTGGWWVLLGVSKHLRARWRAVKPSTKEKAIDFAPVKSGRTWSAVVPKIKDRRHTSPNSAAVV